jgi:DNA (cytosine-5)-methyltransferase 1
VGTGRRRRVLDLFCGAGGSSYGYYLAGCEVTGVDIEPQPHYPFEFHQADAMTYPLDGVDLIHASPPCEGYSLTLNLHPALAGSYPVLIAPVRERLIASGIPWVIENVWQARAELIDPILLCGAMFGLRTYRHRLFETSFPLTAPPHPSHMWRQERLGKRALPGQRMRSLVGNFRDTPDARDAMGISWMTRDEMRQAIPPAYTSYIASQGARQCLVCLRWWVPNRVHAKTCSPACRKALSRASHAAL